MVWRVPEDEELAARDLLQMYRIGVEAVRTGVVRSERLLTLADTLGIQFYQDLPLEYFTAYRLQAVLPQAGTLLDQVLMRARAHPSARHFGLARNADTSDPAACVYFETLAERVRQANLPGSEVYYLSAFTEADRCADAVDFVLLDALDAERPADVLARWRARHGDAPAGIGTVGTWVRSDSARGLRMPHSPEAQARYLEEALHMLVLDAAEGGARVVFVYRWRDVDSPVRSPAFDVENPHRRPYGLIDADGRPRLAMGVVQGLYTGRQDVFAFEPGRQPAGQTPWLILAGWGVFALIGIYYALSPRFRHMVPRYFRAHNFYQDAVREGRDVLFGASMVLLVAVAAAAGTTLYVVLESVRREDAFVALYRWIPEGLQQIGLTLMAEPWALVTLAGVSYAVVLVLWSGLLAALSRRGYMLVGAQGLMLALWPRWPLLLVMAAAMVVGSGTAPLPAALGAVVLMGAWLVVTLYALVRTLVDYTAVTRVPLWVPAVLLVVNPLVIAGLVLLVVWLQAPDRAAFLWHLATRV